MPIFELANNAELTGRELDALICERVFGLVRCQGAKHDADYPNTYCYALPESPAEGAESRCYSTSVNDAWEIVEKLQPRFTITVRGYPDGSWECEFKELHPRSSKRYRHYYVATHQRPAGDLPGGTQGGGSMTCTHGVSLMLPCPQCDADAKAHEQRVSEEQQRAADARIVAFHQAAYGPSSDDSWAEEPEEGEPGYRCPGCGELYDSKCRTARDRVCFQCRYPERD